jgi:opacity protein-like surface antigen
MKKALMAVVMVISITIIARAQEMVTPVTADPNAPEITFESETIDYGTIDYASNGVREFKFTNTGKTPLIISGAAGSCGCTTPEWPREEIKPGETRVIKVKYDTNRVGSFEKNITVTSNAKTPNKVLRIKGMVNPNPNPAGNTTTPSKG